MAAGISQLSPKALNAHFDTDTDTQAHTLSHGENVEKQTPALLAHRRHHMAYEQRAASRHLPYTIHHLPFTRPSATAYLSSCTTTNKCV